MYAKLGFLFLYQVISRPVKTGGLGGGGLQPTNNFQTVVWFLDNSVLDEKEYNGQLPQYEFRSETDFYLLASITFLDLRTNELVIK